jgi:sensor histidine kinase YesM
MEVMRFNNRFIYSIEINDDVALEHIEVPPLLIQPYVENAIWHGLMHREKEGKLKISIFHKMDILYITIEDNGVGRAKAAELKSKSATIQKSHGLQVTAARIDLINQLYNTQNKVFITDLYDKNGEASGTRVELSLE